MTRLLLCAALALSACAAQPMPPAPPERPVSYPAAARERLLRFALEEWRDWGCVVRGVAGEPIAPCGRAERLAANPEGLPRNFPRVLAYWRVVPEGLGAIRRNRELYAQGADGVWEEPYWSAAFISWVMAAAGIDRVEFRPDASHARYLDHLDAVAAAWPTLAPFVVLEAAAVAPAPGDVVCRDRSSRPLLAWSERAAERGQFRPMHCDIVVATGPGVIEVVGGNVSDAVTLNRLEASSDGRLPPGWLAVVRNRI